MVGEEAGLDGHVPEAESASFGRRQSRTVRCGLFCYGRRCSTEGMLQSVVRSSMRRCGTLNGIELQKLHAVVVVVIAAVDHDGGGGGRRRRWGHRRIHRDSHEGLDI